MRRNALALTLLLPLLGCEQTPDVVALASSPLDTGGIGGGGMAAGAGTAGTATTGGAGGAPSGGMGAAGSGSAGTGGAAGAAGPATGGSDAGTADEDREEACRTLGVTLALFREPAQTCTFDIGDPQLLWLLYDHVFRHPPVRIDPEVVAPDALCTMYSTAGRIAPVRHLQDGIWLICPAYCVTLNQWIDDHLAEVRACLPDAGMISP